MNSNLARNTTVDGMRGIAAMLVVIYHLYINTESLLRPLVPSWMHALIGTFGAAGVNVFFVLSGFVITLSLRGAPLSAGYVGMFALRRSVRLDPPYWVTILICIGMAKLSSMMFSELAGRGQYSAPQLIAHLFYLQDILGYENISAVFWTLCIELQFYLVLVVLLTLCAKKTSEAERSHSPPIIAIAALTLLSLVVDLAHIRLPLEGLFVRYWHMFGLGVVTCWCLFKDIDWRWWWALILIEVCIVFAFQSNFARLTPILGASVIVLTSIWPAAKGFLSGSIHQYLGRLSYSLYLMHPIVGWSTISILKKVFGESASLPMGLAYMAAGVLASVVSADLLYRLVERPAINLSKKIPLPRHSPRAAMQCPA